MVIVKRVHSFPAIEELTNGCSEKLYGAENKGDIDEADVSQPACTAMQIALVDLLKDWRILPFAVCGHSSGEIAAAYAAGSLSKEDAVKVAYFRGQSVSRMRESSTCFEGAMLAVGLGASEVDIILSTRLSTTCDGHIGIGCINSPSSVTVSGDRCAIEALQQLLEADGLFSRLLKVNVAYHSPQMQSAAGTYRQALRELKPHYAQVAAFFSSVTGDLRKPASLDTEYWVQNLTSVVRFSNALETMCLNTTPDIIVEIGPHNALESPIKQTLSRLKAGSVELPMYMSTIKRKSNALCDLQKLAARLYMRGVLINFRSINKGLGMRDPRVLTDLPPYQWSHSEQYWHEARVSANYRQRQMPRHELLGILEPTSTPIEPLWRNYLRLSELPWLTGHVVGNDVIFPAACYIAMVIEAAKQHYCHHLAPNDASIHYQLKEVNFERTIIIGQDDAIETLCSLKPYLSSSRDIVSDWLEFRISSTSVDREWSTNCQGLIKAPLLQTEDSDFSAAGLEAVVNGFDLGDIDVGAFYHRCRDWTLNWETPFKNIERAYRRRHGTILRISLPDIICNRVMETYFMSLGHPTVLDAGFQGLLMAAFGNHPDLVGGAYIPTFMEELTLVDFPDLGKLKHCVSHVDLHLIGQRHLVGDVTFYAPKAQRNSQLLSPLVALRGLTCSRLAAAPEISRSSTSNIVHQLVWVPDIDQMSASQIQHQCLSGLDAPNSEHNQDIKLLERAALTYIKGATEAVTDMSRIPQDHHRKLLAWMQQTVQHNDAGDTAIQPNQSVRSAKNQLALLDRVGQHLPSILLGTEDSLALMATDRLLDAFYTDTPYQRTYLQMANIVRLMTLKNPHMSVIEIGAGTGGATFPILEHLWRSNDQKKMPLRKFVFTDISTGFFDTAKSVFQQWEDLMNYRKLDIESDPSLQGIQGDHDLVIAANVLHATTDVRKTLRNTRALLRQGGKLILMELTKFRIYVQTIFGTLKGWWLGMILANIRAMLLTVYLQPQMTNEILALCLNLRNGVSCSLKKVSRPKSLFSKTIRGNLPVALFSWPLRKSTSLHQQALNCQYSMMGNHLPSPSRSLTLQTRTRTQVG